MGVMAHTRCPVLVLLLSLAWMALSECDVVSGSAQHPAIFLTVKGSNFCMTKVDHVRRGYLIVTDILISPEGVPLPFFNDNSVSKRKSGLKIIASFGGSVVPSELFAFLSSDDQRRSAFVCNVVEFTLGLGFHGIDLAWLYPAPQEREQYVRLLKDLRVACDRNGLVLTVTVPSRPSVIEVNYPVEKIQKYADYVILSTTEFRKLRKTSFIAPLYSCSPGSSNSIDYHVDRWKMAGLSSSKIVIVIQTMTLTYKLYIQNEYRVGTPALQLKIRPYYKICRKLYSGSLEIWDSNVKSAYAFRDLSWYSYENEKSIKEKVGFVVQQGLGGLAVFFYDEDDPINICGDGQYPLTAIVMSALQSQYHPPSVISDSQVYHYDSQALSPLSQMDMRNYNPPTQSKRPIYVEEKNLEPPRVSGQTVGPTGTGSNRTLGGSAGGIDQSLQNMFGSVEHLFDWVESASEELVDELGNDFSFSKPQADGNVRPSVKLDELVKLPSVSSGSDGSSFMFGEQEAVPSTVQLFSESAPTAVVSTCRLFSEQSNNLAAVYKPHSSCKSCTASKPCSHCVLASPPSSPMAHPAHCPHKVAGIRIFATAHGPTTTTATTTVAPPSVHFFTMPTFKPPACCHACKPCLQLVATGGVEYQKVTPHPTPCPHTTPAPCPRPQLFSEQSYPQPARGVQIHATAVGAQPIAPFVPFEVKICPHDGILQDPLDRRSYYLCKRGFPMCDENKFTCAHGYIFNEESKKCVPERSCK